jgi:hypothetical protein
MVAVIAGECRGGVAAIAVPCRGLDGDPEGCATRGLAGECEGGDGGRRVVVWLRSRWEIRALQSGLTSARWRGRGAEARAAWSWRRGADRVVVARGRRQGGRGADRWSWRGGVYRVVVAQRCRQGGRGAEAQTGWSWRGGRRCGVAQRQCGRSYSAACRNAERGGAEARTGWPWRRGADGVSCRQRRGADSVGAADGAVGVQTCWPHTLVWYSVVRCMALTLQVVEAGIVKVGYIYIAWLVELGGFRQSG